jgi:hypothetical protein
LKPGWKNKPLPLLLKVTPGAPPFLLVSGVTLKYLRLFLSFHPFARKGIKREYYRVILERSEESGEGYSVVRILVLSKIFRTTPD